MLVAGSGWAQRIHPGPFSQGSSAQQSPQRPRPGAFPSHSTQCEANSAAAAGCHLLSKRFFQFDKYWRICDDMNIKYLIILNKI